MRHDSASVIGLYRPPSLRCGFLRRQRQVADRCRRGSESTHAPNSCPSACCISCRCDANEDTAYPRPSNFPIAGKPASPWPDIEIWQGRYVMAQKFVDLINANGGHAHMT